MSIRLAVSLAILVHASAARADDCACDVTPAACDAGCACDLECAIDWSVDECADPAAGCLQNSTVPDEATLAAQEDAAPVDDDPVDWPVGAPAAPTTGDEVGGGCAAASAGWLVAAAVLALFVFRRRMLALALAACALDPGGWDDAVDRGPTGDTSHIDVFAAELDDAGAMQYLLANQPLQPGAHQPVAQFALSRERTGEPIVRVAGACGDQLANRGDGEALGWARGDAGDGTAELVELAAPDGCTFVYETDPETIADLVADGYTRTQSLGYVWPPGLGDEPVSEPAQEPLATPTPCTITRGSALDLLYAAPGDPYTLRFLLGCPGEVVVGEKRETGPVSAMRTAAAHAAGGRTAFVLDRNGDKLRALLARPNGFERTIAYLEHKLAIGYDYIVLDEVTSASDYADGQRLNRAVRGLLMRLPARSFIPYISIDLTQELPHVYMDDRKLLLRAFEHRARVLALEVYMKTDQVMAGEAPHVFRVAAERISHAVAGLHRTAGINAHAITTIGATHRSSYPQYRYLDDPHHDLASITRQVNALRHASRRTRQQHGVGWYFVNHDDLLPVGSYTLDELVRRMRTQQFRFR